MKPEPTQKGNPYQLTLRQHLFPSRSISRFCNNNGRVDLYMFKHDKRREAKPNDDIFCARRKWDERSEKGYGKNIEDKFQEIADRVLKEKSSVLLSENLSITEFYALWNLRYHWSKIAVNDALIKGIKELAFEPLTIDAQEQLEKRHIVYPTNEMSFSGRHMRGMSIQRNIDTVVEAMVDVKWGVLVASEGEFIVPDNFLERRIVPVTPKVCFVAEHGSGCLSVQDVNCINSLAIHSAKEFIFAENLEVVKSELNSLGVKI